MTRQDAKTLVLAAGTWVLVFMVGIELCPDSSVEVFLVAMLGAFVVIGIGANGWKEFFGEAVVQGAICLVLYLVWRVAAGWFKG